MNYERIYREFIADRRAKEADLIASGEYFERHHIVPRSLGGPDDESNLIALTAGDHFFAHLCLAKWHGGNQWLPVVMMSDTRKDNKFSQRSLIEAARVKSYEAQIHWTPEALIEDAKKYATKAEWVKGNSSGWYLAKRRGVFNECVSHMPIDSRVKWNKESLQAEANKYNSRSEWKRKSSSSYATARRLGVLDYAAQDLKLKMSKPLTKEDCIIAARKYKTKAEWGKGPDASSYNKAKIEGWFDECSAHMKLVLNKGVVNIDTGKRFDTVSDAAKFVGLSCGSIYSACSKGSKAGGYKWAYAA